MHIAQGLLRTELHSDSFAVVFPTCHQYVREPELELLTGKVHCTSPPCMQSHFVSLSLPSIQGAPVFEAKLIYSQHLCGCVSLLIMSGVLHPYLFKLTPCNEGIVVHNICCATWKSLLHPCMVCSQLSHSQNFENKPVPSS